MQRAKEIWSAETWESTPDVRVGQDAPGAQAGRGQLVVSPLAQPPWQELHGGCMKYDWPGAATGAGPAIVGAHGAGPAHGAAHGAGSGQQDGAGAGRRQSLRRHPPQPELAQRATAAAQANNCFETFTGILLAPTGGHNTGAG
jgi:hypothetical protein